MYSHPLVSICIPTFNGAAYLSDALESALIQTYRNIEIIVSDDSSSDDTLRIVESFKGKTTIPIYVYHHQPSGIAANWDHAVQRASGEYIKFLFQDDLLMPHCIEEMLAVFAADEAIGLVFSKREIISEVTDTKWIAKHNSIHLHWKVLNPINEGKELLKDPGLLTQPMNKVGEPSVVMFKKEVFHRVGPFHPQLKQKLDYEYWFRIMKSYKVGFVDKELSAFRFHAAQATGGYRKSAAKKRLEEKRFYNILRKDFFKYLHPLVKIKVILYCGLYNTFVS